MRTLIVLQEMNTPMFRRRDPDDEHSLMIKINHKPFLEYLLDFAVLTGSRAIRIVMDEPDSEIKHFFRPGSYRNIPLSYSSIHANDSLSQIIGQNMPFCRSSSLMFIFPDYFIHYNQNIDTLSPDLNVADGVELTCDTGSVLYAPVDDLRPTIARVSPKLKIRLSPLSSRDDISALASTIKGNNSYLSPIRVRFRPTETKIRHYSCQLLHLTLALVLMVLQICPFFFLSIYLTIRGRIKFTGHKYLINSSKTIILPLLQVGNEHISSRIFTRLSLDRLPLLFFVISGRLALMGSSLLRDNQKTRSFLTDFTNYKPGVFSHSEAMGIMSECEEQELTDRYFADQPCTLITDVVKLYKALINRVQGQP